MYQKVERSEHKYYISYEVATRLQNELAIFLPRDPHSQLNEYMVRSLYFDTINNQDYYEKINGYETRKKIRLRIYDVHTDVAKLEMKAKDGAYQHKYSMTISKAEGKQLIQGDYGVLLDHAQQVEVATLLFKTMTLGAYQPVVMIEYDRTAYQYQEFNVRLTFDRHVKSCEWNTNLFAEQIDFMPVMTDYVLLEVKYDRILPKFISDILKRYSLSEVANSKYYQGRKIFSEVL